MRHGKDVMLDKPGATTLEQLAELRRVQADTKRIVAVLVGRHESRTTARAGQLIAAGAIGRVIQVVALAPHRMNPKTRPPWFFERQQYGGSSATSPPTASTNSCSITKSTDAAVVAAQVGNMNHPQFPGLEDFGDVMLRGSGGSAYIRVDWFTPGGLATWGTAG